MTFLLVALLLGAVQGATEFLPVSSSGHLVLLQVLFGLEPNLALTALLHVGTLLAVLAFFRRDLWQITCETLGAAAATLRRRRASGWDRPGARLGLYVLIATLPTGVIGLTLEHFWVGIAVPGFVAAGFLVTAALLWLTKGRMVAGHGIGWKEAVMIGTVQGLAVIPGISRSGSTIAAALLLGVEREQAGRFSFLASVPAVAGAGLLEVRHLALLDSGRVWASLAGMVVAAVVGYGALALLLGQVRRGTLHYYAFYLVVAAGAVLINLV